MPEPSTVAPSPAGRPSPSLSEPLVIRIRTLVASGNDPVIAAQACGVKGNTYGKWVRLAREEMEVFNRRVASGELLADTDPYSVIDASRHLHLDLLFSVDQAEAEAEAR